MMNFNSYSALKCLFVLIFAFHILYCPYTKVEESFNIQAIHDIQFYGLDISKYDHLEFPGVVPRTFIGPLFVSVLSYPLSKIAYFLTDDLFVCQLIARFTLGLLVALAFFHFTDTVRKLYGPKVAKYTILITITQFHFCFYMSRTLPNTFALIVFLHAISYWLKERFNWFIWLSAFTILVIRAELCIMAGIMLVLILQVNFKKFKLVDFIQHAVFAGVVSIIISVLVDSYFWRIYLWPEGQVLWFNVVLNKSSNYGTSPFFWYFYSAIPRAMMFTLFIIPFGFLNHCKNTFVQLFLPTIGFVLVYSLLPHKELRFILYVFPLLNAIAAKGIVDLQKYRTKWQKLKALLLLLTYSHLLLNIVATCGFLYISKLNYPGAEALNKLHQLESKETNVNVHLDVLSAQTGITRFNELNRYKNWSYDKSEDLPLEDILKFDYIIVDADSDDDKRLLKFKDHHKAIETIKSYKGIYFSFLGRIPLPKIKWDPVLYILRKI